MTPPPTPLVDAAFTDPLAIPAGLDELLRQREARARELLAEALRAQGTGAAELPILADVREQLTRFLSPEGALPRLLRRPVAQLAPDKPAVRSFERFCTGLFARAADALEAAATLSRAATERQRLLGQFGERFPDTLARLGREHRAAEDDLRAIRRGEDARAFLVRLGRVEARLRLLQDALPPGTLESPPRRIEGVAEPLTLDELIALFQVRLLQRAAFAGDPSAPRRRLRRLAHRHLQALGDRGGWAPGAEALPDVVAQTLAERTLTGPGEADSGEDGGVWSQLLAAADRAGAGLAGGWYPRVNAPLVQEEPRWTETDHFVIPIGGSYVAITPAVRSPVLVRESREGLVECAAFDAGPHIDLRLAELDVAPLFAGLEPAQAGWYRTERTAQLRLLASDGETRFATLVLRGAVRRTKTPATRPRDDTGGTLRVLQSPGSLAWRSVVEVEAADRRIARGWGVETRAVSSPFPGSSRLWLRTPDDGTTMTQLERESRRLAALQKAACGCALEPLAHGRLEDGREGILYRPPFALRLRESDVVGEWLEPEARELERQGEVLRGVAARAGLALGVYHSAAFAYSLEASEPAGRAVPALVVIHANWATPFGERFPALEEEFVPEYRLLRYRGVVPSVIGALASEESDRPALALWTLELLARQALPFAGWLDWESMLWAVCEHASSHFRDPALALRLADELRTRSGAR